MDDSVPVVPPVPVAPVTGKPIDPLLLPSAKDYKHYFFLIYYADPTRGRVTIHIDAEEAKTSMTFEKFIDLITETMGWPTRPAIVESLATYGTYWLLDRENFSLRRIQATGSDDLINVRQEILEVVESKGHEDDDPVNGLVDKKYAGAGAPSIPAMVNSPTPFDNVSHRNKKQSRFGIHIPFSKR